MRESHAQSTVQTRSFTIDTVSRQLLLSVALGCVVLYGVAFSASPMLHNAAHDVRHVAATPCH